MAIKYKNEAASFEFYSEDVEISKYYERTLNRERLVAQSLKARRQGLPAPILNADMKAAYIAVCEECEDEMTITYSVAIGISDAQKQLEKQGWYVRAYVKYCPRCEKYTKELKLEDLLA